MTVPTTRSVIATARPRLAKKSFFTLILLVALAVACVLSLSLGARSLSIETILGYLSGASIDPNDAAVLDQRVVRTVWGLLIGAAMALAGAGMQGVTRNPLGDPGILGVNSGAAFAVVTGIVFFSANTPLAFTVLAFVGAVVTSVVVYALAAIGKDGATPVKLALMGAAISAALGSLTSAFILVNQNGLDNLRRWQVGNIAGATLDNLTPGIYFLALGAVIVLLGGHTINSFALGDDMAAALGQNVMLKRLLIFVGVTLLCGTSVALTGPIAFIGLMAPHAVRSFTGPDYRLILPLSALFGATILIIADTLGRVLLPPQEIEVGVSMIVVGVPVFIYLVRKSRAVNL